MKDFNYLKLQEVLSGNKFFDDETRISAKSRYGDDLWDFTDESTKRLAHVPAARLQICWAKYCSETNANSSYQDHRDAIITKQMVEELKILSYLYLKLPSSFALRGVQSVKPQTLVITIRALVLLFSDILQSHQLGGWGSLNRTSPIQSLTDISLTTLTNTLLNSSRADGALICKGLKLLACPIMMKAAFQHRALQWNIHDIKSLNFNFPKKRTDYKKVMPPELFRLLSNTSSEDVLGFLHFIGAESCDGSEKFNCPTFACSIIDGSSLFADYTALRRSDRDYATRTGKKRTGPNTQAEKFKSTYGVGRNEVFNWIYRVQRAAYTLIGLYSGARYSDLTTFHNNCLQEIHGVHVLVGTHVKHQALDAQEDFDLWPAIPIMRDAFSCLKYISEITFNQFLLSSSETLPVGATPRALSLNGFTNAITNYLHEIDKSGRWSDWNISSQQLRHTLAYQLARADVGLLYISHHMKHLHTALNSLPPDVTMMYGNLGDMAMQRALHSNSAYLEAAQELFSPDRPVAGGGAEAFIERRKAYFEGMAAQGWTEDEVIENLAKQGLPFVSVGIGYCGGKRETINKDGTKEIPPCMGSLQCNPSSCKQAVITRAHATAWLKIFEQNLELATDPRMAHAKDPLLAAMRTAGEVLIQLEYR